MCTAVKKFFSGPLFNYWLSSVHSCEDLLYSFVINIDFS